MIHIMYVDIAQSRGSYGCINVHVPGMSPVIILGLRQLHA